MLAMSRVFFIEITSIFSYSKPLFGVEEDSKVSNKERHFVSGDTYQVAPREAALRYF